MQRLDLAGQMVVDQYSWGTCTVAHENYRERQIADHTIIAYGQRSGRIFRALKANSDYGAWVLASLSLLQPITQHEQIAPVGYVHQVAGIAVRPVGDVIVDQHGALRTRLDVMSDMLAYEA